MPSEVVVASIPEELVPLWERLGEAHGGASKFVQWALKVLRTAERASLDAQEQALRSAALHARLEFLAAEIAALQAERARVDALAKGAGAPEALPEPLAAQSWWEQAAARLGERALLEAGERQLRALACRAGADPEACLALVRARQRQASERFFPALPRPPYASRN